jgi:hypothetical protein
MRSVNEANWDRLLRTLIGLGMISVGWLVPSGGLWSAALKVLGFFPLITGVWGWCPISAVLGIGTWPVSPRTH